MSKTTRVMSAIQRVRELQRRSLLEPLERTPPTTISKYSCQLWPTKGTPRLIPGSQESGSFSVGILTRGYAVNAGPETRLELATSTFGRVALCELRYSRNGAGIPVRDKGGSNGKPTAIPIGLILTISEFSSSGNVHKSALSSFCLQIVEPSLI